MGRGDILTHIGDMPFRIDCLPGIVDPIYLPFLRLGNAAQQVQQRTFPGSVGPDDHTKFTGIHVEVSVFDDASVLITKPEILPLDAEFH